MKKPDIGYIFFLMLLCIGAGFWILSMRNELTSGFDARQEVMESGETTMGTAVYVKHKGLMNLGVRYAELQYEVDGVSYTAEVRFAQNFRKLPGEKDAEGRYPVLIHYDEDQPDSAAIECAQKGWKMAKFSLLLLPIFLWLYAAFMLLSIVILGREEYVAWKLSRF